MKKLWHRFLCRMGYHSLIDYFDTEGDDMVYRVLCERCGEIIEEKVY